MINKLHLTNGKSSNKVIYSISLFVYVCLISIGIFYHENWGDEVQQWLLVRDLNLTGVISHLRCEGHLLPWYLILLPFAKLGFPLRCINIISAIFVVFAAALILWKAPFENYKKALFLFCPAMVYYFPVISRCYALVPLSIVCIALSYKDRHEKPVRFLLSLIFLANTHMLMWGMVAAIAIEYFFEFLANFKKQDKTQNKKEIVAMVSAASILAISLMPLIIGESPNATVNFELGKIGNILESVLVNSIHIFPLCFKIDAIGLLLVFITFLFFILEFIKLGKHIVPMMVAIFYQLIIYACMYFTSEQKAMLFFLIVFYFHWINKENKRPIKIFDSISFKNTLIKTESVLGLILLVSAILNSFYFIFGIEVKKPYSNAPYLADYIKENISDESVILVGNEYYIAVSVQGYIPKESSIRFFDLVKQEYYTYVTWDDQVSSMTDKETLENTINEFDSSTELYYLQSTSNISENDEISFVISLVNEGLLEPIFTADDSYYNEDYILYRVKC